LNNQTPLKKKTHERSGIGRASRGGLGAGAGICQTLSQSQRLAAPQTRQNRAGGVFGVWMGLGVAKAHEKRLQYL